MRFVLAGSGHLFVDRQHSTKSAAGDCRTLVFAQFGRGRGTFQEVSRAREPSGTCSQDGRLRASYTTS
jgi:hypothetical protein